MKVASTCCLMLFAATQLCRGQTTGRVDSVTARITRTGTWAANGGTLMLMGTWTAVPDSAHGTVTGSWTIADAQGKTVIYGAWSAAKAVDKWTGVWRAVVAGRSGEYSGTWTSSVDLKGGGQFNDLFEKAVPTMVSGTWASGGNSGAWSIRTAPRPP